VSIVLLCAGGVLAAAHFTRHEIKRTGTESLINVTLDAAYGSLRVMAGTAPGIVTKIETDGGEDGEDPPIKVRYGIQGQRGNLRITLGEDAGSKANRPLAMWHANSGFTLASASGALYSDMGGKILLGEEPELRYRPLPQPALATDNKYRSNVYLTTEVPLSLNADLGFGESTLDLTGLILQAASIETGASRSRILLKQPNPGLMTQCNVSAGVGEFAMEGICNLNAAQFNFSGGLGYYKLGFAGKLSRNMEATVSVGLGKCSLSIPPEAGRVEVFYDDGFFNSYKFTGLTKRKEGYATSVGFENSRAPILTLRLSSGMGNMVVSYR
jgi:hypothetical protein